MSLFFTLISLACTHNNKKIPFGHSVHHVHDNGKRCTSKECKRIVSQSHGINMWCILAG